MAALAIVLLPILAACGGGSDSGDTDISWQPGLPTQTVTAETPPPSETQTTDVPADATTAPDAPTPTVASTVTTDPGVSGQALTADQLAQYQPNELGKILVLEYHQLTNDPAQVAQFVRTYDSLRADLQWLYDNNFYVVSMASVIENTITAPAGKKPVVLTFDDSPVNQFRFLVGGDGTLTVDPESGVGILEAFYQAHPDFGRGGLFGTLPNSCFFGDIGGAVENDQIDLCSQKLNFLIDNGYEVGNHTLNHENIQNVDDDVFKEEVGGAIDALQALDSRVQANIFVVPFGLYPEFGTRDNQRVWMQDGFEWNGKEYKLIGSLMVGSEPAFSPVSTEWDSMWIARIQMCDCTEQGGSGWDDMWKQVVTDNPAILYVSDGDPNTITIPNTLDPTLDGTLDDSKAEGKEVIRY
ncbi:polysaccharide deacetylase family protein [soil metagenome]